MGTCSKKGTGEAARYDIALSNVSRAPDGLVNPRQRAVWEGMDLARNLVQMREKERISKEMAKEKSLLGLPDEEEILFRANGSWLPMLPVTLLSVAFIVLSSISSLRLSTGASFALLAVGLIGLLMLNAGKGVTTYYLTNLRALAFKRSMFGKGVWSSVQYADVNGCHFNRSFLTSGVELWGGEDRLSIKRLSREQFANVKEILRFRLSLTTRS